MERNCHRLQFCRCVVLLEAIVIAGWIAALVIVHKTQSPRQQGFVCDDVSLRYPVRPDTVSETFLLVVSLALPLVFFISMELADVLYLCARGRSQHPAVAHRCRPFCLSPLVGVAGVYAVYFFGYLVQNFVCVFLKNLVGRPRPNFVEVCQPRVGLNACQGLVWDYTCTNTAVGESELKSVRQSFPSGHASTSVYMSLFIIFYVEQRLQHCLGPLFRLSLELGLATWALWCSATRLTDNAHHVSDVMAGVVIGVVAAVAVYFRAAVACLRHTDGRRLGGKVDLEQGCDDTNASNNNNNNNNRDKILPVGGGQNISDEDSSENLEMDLEAPTTPTPLLSNGVHSLTRLPTAQRSDSFRLGSFQLQRDKTLFRKFSLR